MRYTVAIAIALLLCLTAGCAPSAAGGSLADADYCTAPADPADETVDGGTDVVCRCPTDVTGPVSHLLIAPDGADISLRASDIDAGVISVLTWPTEAGQRPTSVVTYDLNGQGTSPQRQQANAQLQGTCLDNALTDLVANTAASHPSFRALLDVLDDTQETTEVLVVGFGTAATYTDGQRLSDVQLVPAGEDDSTIDALRVHGLLPASPPTAAAIRFLDVGYGVIDDAQVNGLVNWFNSDLCQAITTGTCQASR